MSKLYFFISNPSPKDPWYNANIVSALIGAFVALFGTFIALYFSEKNRKRDERKNMIILMHQANSDLFYQIYNESINKGSINHTQMRQLLKNFNLIYLLPVRLRTEFEKINKVYLSSPDEFQKKSNNIHNHCVNIIKYIDEYGAGIFG